MTAMTKEKIRDLLLNSDYCVERAMIVLFERQTETEQWSNMTQVHNARGFSSSDAANGSYYARWVKSGKRLTGGFLQKARQMSLKYTRQLLEAAEAKAAAKAEARADAEMAAEAAIEAQELSRGVA